jgi:hypothetical protein
MMKDELHELPFPRKAKTTPAKALGVVDRAWTIGALMDAALATQPITPVPTAPEPRKLFTVVQGGKK